MKICPPFYLVLKKNFYQLKKKVFKWFFRNDVYWDIFFCLLLSNLCKWKDIFFLIFSKKNKVLKALKIKIEKIWRVAKVLTFFFFWHCKRNLWKVWTFWQLFYEKISILRSSIAASKKFFKDMNLKRFWNR